MSEPTREDRLYLATVIDLQTRQVLSCALYERMPDDLVKQAFLNLYSWLLQSNTAALHTRILVTRRLCKETEASRLTLCFLAAGLGAGSSRPFAAYCAATALVFLLLRYLKDQDGRPYGRNREAVLLC